MLNHIMGNRESTSAITTATTTNDNDMGEYLLNEIEEENETLYSPDDDDDDDDEENDGNENERVHERGEKQPNEFRDWPFGVLFLSHFVAIFIVAMVCGAPVLQRTIEKLVPADNDNDNDSNGNGNENDEMWIPEHFVNIVYVLLASAGISFLISFVMVLFMIMRPKSIIKASVLFSASMSVSMALYAMIAVNMPLLVISLLFAGLTFLYVRAVWSRIPFAAANLETGLTAVKKNFGVTFVVLLMQAIAIAFSAIWSIALIGALYNTSDCKEDGEDIVCDSNPNYGVIFIFLVSYYWSQQVISTVLHVTVAGMIGTWWFSPEDASSCCSAGLGGSFFRATTYSFGSICLGSLLVAAVQTLRALVRQLRSQSERRDDGCASILLCILDCLVSLVEDVLVYFNKWAFIYVGIYGYPYLTAGKGVMELFRARGWDTIITDDLVSNALSLVIVITSMITGIVGIVAQQMDPQTFDIFSSSSSMADGSGSSSDGTEVMPFVVAYVFCFIVGVIISSTLFGIVDSAVNTVVVLFAEAPEDFDYNHKKLSDDMKSAWTSVYPDYSYIDPF